MNKEQIKEFEEISNMMIKFINDNGHPHMSVIITSNTAELVEGVIGRTTEEFIKD